MFAESVFRIEGSEGTIEHNGKLRVKNRHMREWIKPPIPSVPCNEYDWTFSVSMRQLIEAIEGNEKPATSIENNMKVIKTVYACYESAIARKWISIGSHQLK
jgi:predicted dehydrogenase